MARVIVYGNCQVGPLGWLLQNAAPGLEVVRVPPVHTIAENQAGDIEAAIQSSDIVLSQDVGNHYGALSTEALRGLPGERTWISFPSIYFGGLFPYLAYLRQEGGAPLKGPISDYHDLRIVRSYLAGNTESECAAMMQKPDTEYCARHFEKAIAESTRRELGLSVKIMDYVSEHVTSERIFHTFNHPSNAILWHVAIQFLRLIDQEVDSAAKPPVTQFLDEVSAAIPAEMADAVGLKFQADIYRLKGQVIPWKAIIADFYRVYSGVPDFSALCSRNGVVRI